MRGKDDEMVDLKSRCMSLIFDCPRKVSSAGCPFEAIRRCDVVDQVKWVKAKTVRELRSLLEQHELCITPCEEVTVKR